MLVGGEATGRFKSFRATRRIVAGEGVLAIRGGDIQSWTRVNGRKFFSSGRSAAGDFRLGTGGGGGVATGTWMARWPRTKSSSRVQRAMGNLSTLY